MYAVTTPTDLICYDSSSGALAVNVTGGTVPYYYKWSISGVSTSATSTSGLDESQMYPFLIDLLLLLIFFL
jgi:SprB repeat